MSRYDGWALRSGQPPTHLVPLGPDPGGGRAGGVADVPRLDQRLHDQGQRGLPPDGPRAPPLHPLEPAVLLGVADALLDRPPGPSRPAATAAQRPAGRQVQERDQGRGGERGGELLTPVLPRGYPWGVHAGLLRSCVSATTIGRPAWLFGNPDPS